MRSNCIFIPSSPVSLTLLTGLFFLLVLKTTPSALILPAVQPPESSALAVR